jgi:hypothetical protein
MSEQLAVLAVKKQRHSIEAASAKKDELGLSEEGVKHSLHLIVRENSAQHRIGTPIAENRFALTGPGWPTEDNA